MPATKEFSAGSYAQEMISRVKARARMVKPMKPGTIERIQHPAKPFDRFEALREFYAAFNALERTIVAWEDF